MKEPDSTHFLSREQARKVDRHAIEELGMAGVVLMENAGRGCVDLMEHVGINGHTAILCGSGNNGGDGFVIARQLLVRGHKVTTFLLAKPEKLSGDARTNYEVLNRLGAEIVDLSPFEAREIGAELASHPKNSWIVDALLGTGATGEPRKSTRAAILWANQQPSLRLAIDLPSGLDCDTGEPSSVTFRADHTVTFVAAKAGFMNKRAADYLGQLYIAHIGVPLS